MTDAELATALASHVNSRSEPHIRNGAWSMMLDAAGRLTNLAITRQRLQERIADYNQRLLVLHHENSLDESEVDRLQRNIRQRNEEAALTRSYLSALQWTVDELNAIPPDMGVRRANPITVERVIRPSHFRDIMNTEEVELPLSAPPPPSLTGDANASTEAQTAAASQPGGQGADAPLSDEADTQGHAVSAQTETPAEA